MAHGYAKGYSIRIQASASMTVEQAKVQPGEGGAAILRRRRVII
jgi:hypothetical protein